MPVSMRTGPSRSAEREPGEAGRGRESTVVGVRGEVRADGDDARADGEVVGPVVDEDREPGAARKWSVR